MMATKTAYSIPFQYKYHGIIFNEQDYPPDNVDKTREVKLREGDVLILSYPRTGTTLLGQTTSLLLCESKEEIERQDDLLLNERIPYLERSNPANRNQITDFINQCGPRILQSHLPSSLSKQWWERDSGAKVVCIIRNPKDALVSLFHFYQGMPCLGRFPGSWSEFFELYKSGSMLYGDGVEWSLEMWKHRHHPDIRVLFYEDLVKSPQEQIRQLGDFFQLDRSDALIDEVVARTSFQAMKSNSRTNYKHDEFNGFEFVRKGKIGNWKSYFTVAQSEWMDEHITKTLGASDLTFQYE